MSSASTVAQGRRLAERRMIDTCRVRATEREEQWNETTKGYDVIDPTYSYEGACLVKFGATLPRQVDAAGQVVIEQQIEMQFPIDSSTGILPGHVVELLTSATDPGLAGREFRVIGQFHQTYATSRRLPVEEVF